MPFFPSFAIPPLMSVAWIAIKASRVLQIALIALPLAGYLGIKAKSALHDRRISIEATTIERQSAEIRALRLRAIILSTYASAGHRRAAERDRSIEDQRAELDNLTRQLEDARHASSQINNPRRPVFRADDPWMRQGTAAGR